MRAGDLNRRIRLMRRVQIGVNDHNAPIYQNELVRTLWAAMIFKSADEEFAVSQRYATRLVTFRTRYFSGLEATDTIECENITYDVKGWRQIGLRTGLEISAEWQQ